MGPQSVTVSGFTTLIDVQNGEYFVPLYSTLFYSLIQGLNYRNIIRFGKPYLRLYGLCPPEVSKMFLWPRNYCILIWTWDCSNDFMIIFLFRSHEKLVPIHENFFKYSKYSQNNFIPWKLTFYSCLKICFLSIVFRFWNCFVKVSHRWAYFIPTIIVDVQPISLNGIRF